MAAGHHGNHQGPGGAEEAEHSTLIQGRYRLHELIGRGGMGEVWRALDESLGRRVAVKCLKPAGQARDAGFTRILQERFRREARVAAALQHRGVTVVHDFGEHDGVLYLVMELLDGRNLLQVLDDARRHPLPVPDIIDIAEQVADALAYTHAQGIVHRDLKPANIIRLSDGAVKICDFGIARLGHDIGFTSRLTGTGVAMGTPHYMSPEQIGASGEVDHRSDLYSLGCVLYELATGAPPFDLGDTWAILVGHRDNVPEPPRATRPELPVDLERLILDLLAKAPDDRPQDAADVGGRLKALRAGTGSPHTGAGPGPARGTAELPGWARQLTTGSAAASTRSRHTVNAPRHELTGAWSTRALQAGPRPGVLTELADRHAEGIDLARVGNWRQAYDLHTAVAAARDHAQGTEHPDTLASRYEAAYCLTGLGRTEEALQLYAYVGETRARVLGPDHPDTLAARHEAAYALGLLGRHLEAHQEYAEVLAARVRTTGPDHPDTLQCKHNLAFNLGRLGRTAEAHTMAVEVAEARTRVLGAEHPQTLVTRFEVGHLLGASRRWAEALDVYRDVAAVRTRVLGPGHPDTLAVDYEIGICLGRLGRSAEALTLYENLVEARTRTAGSTDAETLRARHALGVNLGRLGHWERALAEARDVAAVRERVLGHVHPDTLVSKREIAVGLGWLGRWSGALTVYHEVADAREQVLGPAHPDTLTSRNDEAQCLEQLGRSAEAQILYDRVAAQQQNGPQRL
ncbi:serine/threonine-protein kinase [Streptomyces cocklensis]|uniref:non-specific serine/threonine protein kinase n=1 Tax=Actinacidiphila cocklensis TaxID=887465 RepID=A0A9W4DMY4_9ACTN|nr:serine/threonine-protein kinase [Actinacidiphila cocklensis]MDD1063873.1 serine/threonine-protein kinase [Actinacidiphila cocklensis]WSX73148.1 serine/threonine-protein kinase [Streptomyces sp. NBC_00899]WSX80786.1 serine/threonine-protein kinase [Streptomyces sp. NBC_00899]CAG6392568.1 Serine/threonine protein kinase [Actinacidiphila cocklensis]